METTRASFSASMNFPALSQVLNHGGDGTDGWCQIPPSTMPWGIPMANQPTVVRFTAGPTALMKTCDLIKCGDFFHTKRKLEDDMDSLGSHKQLITEEKMAARLSEIHISSNFAGQQSAPTTATSETKEGEFSGFKPKGEEETLKRLVLCEEMKNLKSEPIIPASLLTKLEKPSMALVLWQPPSDSLFKHLRAEQRFGNKEGVVKMEEEEEQQNQQPTSLLSSQVFNNNNTLALDLNSMDTGFSQVCRPSSMSGVDEMEC